MTPQRTFQFSCLMVVSLLAAVAPAHAKILKTRPRASETWSPLLALTIGSGFEFETDGQQSVYDFPILVEYNLTEALKLTAEPHFVYIESKSADTQTLSGWGDLETTLEYEFLRERRYRPALTAEGLIKWPTARSPDLDTDGTDYTIGLIASKDLVFFDLDINTLYTFVGSRDQKDTFEISVGSQRHLNNFLDLEAEVLTSVGGGVRGQPGTIAGIGTRQGTGGNESEGTLGIAEYLNTYLKLEEGVVLKSDHSWQIVFAWEYSFSGRD